MTEWFINDGTGVSVHAEDPNMAVLGDYIPDWVRVPPELPDAYQQLRVIGTFLADCPKCQRTKIRHLILDRAYYVAECQPGCGFVWYNFPSDITQTLPETQKESL